MKNCEICGNHDLYSDVTGDQACSICKVTYIGGLPTTPERVKLVREMLGLKAGEFLKVDQGKEARRILGRRY